MRDPHLLRITKIGIYLLLLAPMFFWGGLFFPSISTKLFWLLGVSEVTLFCFLWLIYCYPALRPKFYWQDLFFFFFILFILLTSIAGVYPANSFWGGFERNINVLLWLHLAAVFIILVALYRSERSWLQFSLVSTVIGLCICSAHFFSLFGISILFIGTFGIFTLGNSSIFGSYLLFQFFFSLFLFFRGHKRKLRLFGGGAFVVFVSTLLTTDARSAIIASVGGAIFFLSFILVLEKEKRYRKTCGLILLAGLVIVFFVSFFLVFRPSGWFHELIVKEGGSSRLVVWDIAWEAIKERPILGWGVGNFQYAFLKYYDPCFGNEFCGKNTLFDSSHNKILDVLVESGVLGLLAYLSIFFVTVNSVWHAYKRHGVDRKIFVLFASILAAYFVQNLTFFDTAISLLFFVVMIAFSRAAINFYIFQAPEEISAKTRETKLFALCLVLCSFFLLAAFFFFIVQPIRGALAVKRGATTFNIVNRQEAYERGLSISSFGKDIRRAFLALETSRVLWSYRPIADASSVQAFAPYLRKESSLVETSLRDTLRRSPNDFRSFLYLAMLLQAEGRLFDSIRFAEAENVVQDALVLNPRHPLFYWVLTSIYIEDGKMEEASASMAKAISLSPDSQQSLKKMEIFKKYIEGGELQEEIKYNLLYEFYSE